MAEAGMYKFTNIIQLKILAAMWRDQHAFNLYRDVVKPKYFQSSVLIDLCRIIFDYYDHYNQVPTLDALTQEVTDLCRHSKRKEVVLNEYIDTLEFISEVSLDDLDYIKDKIIMFGKRQALVDSIVEASNILEKEPEAQYPKIEKMVKDALMVGENVYDLGTNIYENIEERFLSYLNDEDVIERIPTDIEALDNCLGGGLGRTEMGVIVAAPGLGKTSTLVSIGGAAVEHGYNVLHVSLENNEKQITRNYDVRLLKHNLEYVKENVEKSIQAMFNIQRYRHGQLRIKKYPTRGASVQTLRTLLDKYKLVQGFVPDVLIVDYGTILKSSINYLDKRNAIESNFEELRALADDYNLALWTAAQGNRGALSKKVVTMSDLAECFAIGNICDVMACLCQTMAEKPKQEMRMFLPKIRDNADKMILKGKIMYDIKKVEMYEQISADDQGSEDKEDEDWDEEMASRSDD